MSRALWQAGWRPTEHGQNAPDVTRSDVDELPWLIAGPGHRPPRCPRCPRCDRPLRPSTDDDEAVLVWWRCPNSHEEVLEHRET
jgi:hypothetical protein